MPETTIPLEGGEGTVSADVIKFVIGQTYAVTWDGVEYAYIAEDFSVMIPGAIVIGGFDMEDPGVIATAPGIGTFVSMNEGGKTETTIAVMGESVKVKKIDPRCLPDGVGDSPVVAITLKGIDENAGAPIMSHTAEEIYKAMMGGKIVFMFLEGQLFTVNGEAWDDDEGNLNKVGLVSIMNPTLVVYVDSNGLLIPPE